MNNDKKSKRIKLIEDRIAFFEKERGRILHAMHEVTDAINAAKEDLANLPLKRFYFNTYIESAEGFHRKYVEAETLEEAKKKLAADYSSAVLYEEDITVELDGVEHWEDVEK